MRRLLLLALLAACSKKPPETPADTGPAIPPCDAPPAAPTADAIDAVVPEPTVVLRGTKPAYTAVLIDGVERAPLGEATSWSAGVDLVAGENRFQIAARNACGTGPSITAVVRHDPGARGFTLDRSNLAPPICDERQTLRGTKGPRVAIVVDGVEVVPADGMTAWSHEVALVEGPNRFAIAGREAGVTGGVLFADLTLHSGRGPFSATATMSASSSTRVVLFGNKPPYAGVAVNGALAVRPDARMRWSVEVAGRQGPDAYVVEVQNECGRSVGAPIRIHYMANLDPLALAILEPTRGATVSGTITIRGTVDREAVSVSLSIDGGTPFAATLDGNGELRATWDTRTVSRGLHTIEARAIDMTTLRTGMASQPVWVQNIGPLVSEDEATPVPSVKPAAAALARGDVAVVWESGAGDVLLRVYRQALVPGPIVTLSSRGHDPAVVAAPSGEAYLAWAEGNAIMLRLRRADGVLEPAMAIATATSAVSSPSLAVESQGNLHLVYLQDRAVRYPRGPNRPMVVASNASAARIAVTPDGCPHVVYASGGAILHRGGCPLGAPQVISDASHSAASSPSIAADPVEARGQVYISWAATFRMQRRVYLRSVTAGQLGSLIPIAPMVAAEDPDIAVTSDRNAHVVWRDATPTPDIFLDNAQPILPTPGRSLAPRVTARGPALFVVWQDDSALDTDAVADFDILHARP